MANEFDYAKYLLLLKSHKRLFAGVALAVMTVAVIVSYVLPRKYQATSTVFIEKNVITDLVKGIAVTASIEDKVKVIGYALGSRPLLSKVIDNLDMNVRNDGDREKLISQFQKNTQVKIKDNEGLFTVIATNEDPRLARDYVNTLVRTYIEQNVSSKRESSYGATRFLSDEINAFRDKMDKAEEKVDEYKRSQGVLLTSDQSVLLQENAAAQQKLDELRIRSSQLESMRNIIKNNNPVRTRVAALQKRLEELRTKYTDNYPEVIMVKTEIETAQQQINSGRSGGEPMAVDPQEMAKVVAELRATRAAEAFQQGIISRNNALLRSIPAAKSDLQRLQRDVETQKDFYNSLVNRHSQAEVSKQIEIQDKATNFRIVDPAVTPKTPISPNRPKIILLGIVAGIAVAFGVLMCIDKFDPAIRCVNGLKEVGLPVMAVIPRIRVEEEVQKEMKRDLTLYRVAGCYFAVILFVLGSEVLGYSFVDMVISRLHAG
jgi:succinoglycan biosynthesis transport protein ExoP